MKKFLGILSAVLLCTVSLWGCRDIGIPQTDTSVPTAESTPAEVQDFAAQLTLDLTSETCKQEVTVKTFIDGDTTHFYVPESVAQNGVLKARYLAIDTPESTGKIEEYGKAASRFTREKLSDATSILIESDTAQWNMDSTGSRYLVWVWYRTADTEPYRNLNIEILQNGLALASSTANNRYGKTGMSALNQAKSQKLGVFSGKPDPDFFYGDAIELTLKELRCSIADYNGKKVAFNGIVTRNTGNGVYVEALDEETGLYSGISVYYGFNLTGDGLDILSVGNEVRIVGTVSYYEAGDTYQVSGLTYRAMRPDDPGNIQKLSEGHKPAFVLTEPALFANGQITTEVNGESRTLPYAQFILNSTVEMKALTVKSAYTTQNEDSASCGAITLTCESGGIPVTVRTAVLRDENGSLITQDAFEGKVLDVKGVVEFFHGQYQIKVLSIQDVTITE